MPAAAVYLDHNATTPVRPDVVSAMQDALLAGGNPSSVHAGGRRARAKIEAARDAVARLAGSSAEAVIFTSGGTEANHLALLGVDVDRILVSSIEHDSVFAAAEKSGRAVERIAVDRDGRLDTDDLRARLVAPGGRALVSVMAANNETGVLQPLDAVIELAHAADGLVHCDAVQLAGKTPLAFAASGFDLMTLSGHKIGAAPGVGALIAAGTVEISALQGGGGQERGRRSGTENLPGIVGFGCAAGLVAEAADSPRLAALRDDLERRLTAVATDAVVFGRAVPRLANTTAIAMPGVDSEIQVMALDLSGVAVSAGAACSSGKVGPSHVLAAMGYGTGISDCAIRISLGWTTESRDIDRLVTAWTDLYRRKRAA